MTPAEIAAACDEIASASLATAAAAQALKASVLGTGPAPPAPTPPAPAPEPPAALWKFVCLETEPFTLIAASNKVRWGYPGNDASWIYVTLPAGNYVAVAETFGDQPHQTAKTVQLQIMPGDIPAPPPAPVPAPPATPVPAPPAPVPAPPAPAPAPPAGLLPSRGSRLNDNLQLDNGLTDLLDMTRARPPVQWDHFTDGNQTIAPSMNGVEADEYTIFAHAGGVNNLYEGMPALVDGKIVQLDPYFGEYAIEVNEKLKSYPERPGPRNNAIDNGYEVGHGHPADLPDGTLSTSPMLPLYVTIHPLGHVRFRMRPGDTVHAGTVPLHSYATDFTYFEHRLSDGTLSRKPRWMFVTDAFFGIRKVDMTDPANWITTDLCGSFGWCTSARSRGGSLIYAVDANAQALYSVDPYTGVRLLVANVPHAFWVDMFSNGDLLITCRDSSLYRVTRAGVVGPNIQLPQNIVAPTQPFVLGDVDFNGTFGIKDAFVTLRITGATNTDLWRFVPDESGGYTVQNLSAMGGFGENSVGEMIHVRDFAHYEWNGWHHPNYAIIWLGGIVNQFGCLLVASKTGQFKHLGSYGGRIPGMPEDGPTVEQYVQLARVIIGLGYDPDRPPVSPVPSLSTMINQSGGSLLGCSSDEIAAMDFPDQVAFLRQRLLSTNYPLDLSPKGLRALLVFFNRNSVRGLKTGVQLLTDLFAFLDSPSFPEPPAPPTGTGGNALEWKSIPNTALGSNSRIAFSGMAVRPTPTGFQIAQLPGGGHGDGNENSFPVCDVAIAGDTLTSAGWKVLCPATPEALRVWDAPWYADVPPKPSARHTYYSTTWDEASKRYLMLGCLSPWGQGGTWYPTVSAFDPVTGTWDAPGSWPDATLLHCFDETGNGWGIGAGGSGEGVSLVKWVRATKTVEQRLNLVPSDPPKPGENRLGGVPLAWDSKRKRLFSLSRGFGQDKNAEDIRAFVYENDGATQRAVTMSGPGYAMWLAMRTEYQALEPDPSRDRFLVYDGRGASAGVLLAIDAQTFEMTVVPTAGKPPETVESGVMNRFRVVGDFAVLLADATQDLHWIKLR